jgi:hypothetical protein
MQIPRGTFASIKKGIHIHPLLIELEKSHFTGACVISHGRTTISLILKNGNCIMAGWGDLNGEDTWSAIQALGNIEVDAALSRLSPAQIALTQEFNKTAIISRMRRASKNEEIGYGNHSIQTGKISGSTGRGEQIGSLESSEEPKRSEGSWVDSPVRSERIASRSSQHPVIPGTMPPSEKSTEPVVQEKMTISMGINEPSGRHKSESVLTSAEISLLQLSGKPESHQKIILEKEVPDPGVSEQDGHGETALHTPDGNVEPEGSESLPKRSAEPVTYAQAWGTSVPADQHSPETGAESMPVQEKDTGNSSSDTNNSPEERYMEELSALDSMDLPGMTEKIRDNCRIIVRGLQLEHLLDRKKSDK